MSANKLGEYQYDTATSHHTTNELHRLHDIEEISLAVEAHDGTKSICRKRGTLIFRHNGREMKHVDTLYDPTYSNLISGQRMPDEHCLDIKKKTAELKEGNKIIYKMRKDNRGALWIRPEDKIPVKAPAEKTVSVQKSALSELHERYMTTKPLQKKSDTTKGLIEIIDVFEAACNPRGKVKQVTSRVHQVQADWGGEFRNDNLKEKLRKRGIVFKETIPGHSETNAIIERTNRTIMTMNRTAILATNGGIPKGRWDKAAGWSAYTKNRVPHKTLDGKSPLEVLLPEKDIIKARENLRPFGQKVICFDYDVTDKLSARSFEARIVGYTHTHGVYKVIDTSGKQRVVKDPKPVIESDNNSDSDSDEEDSETGITESSKLADKSTTETGPSELAKQTFPKDESTKPVEETTIEPAPIKQKRQRKTAQEYTELYGSRQSTRNKKPTEKAAAQAVGANEDHPTEEQARNGQHAIEWASARERERAQLKGYGVYSRVRKDQIPEGTRLVDTKWVYTIKRNADGTVEKFKARKVGRGFTQEYGINYDETYAQIMRPETWRMFLVVAMYRDWDIRQWDVVAAYLQADLDPKHKVYIEDTNEKGEVEYWLLHQALYGLKQSGHEWYQKLRGILDSPECGLTQCVGDEGTYHGYNGLLGSHVDDLLVVGTQERLDEIEQVIERQVELDKRGKPKMLGVELTWNDSSDEVLLTQKGLIETLAKQHGIVGVRTSMPLAPHYFATESESQPTDKTKY
jgi:hypothetical protein